MHTTTMKGHDQYFKKHSKPADNQCMMAICFLSMHLWRDKADSPRSFLIVLLVYTFDSGISLTLQHRRTKIDLHAFIFHSLWTSERGRRKWKCEKRVGGREARDAQLEQERGLNHFLSPCEVVKYLDREKSGILGFYKRSGPEDKCVYWLSLQWYKNIIGILSKRIRIPELPEHLK